MTTNLPIACSLNADELSQRLAEMTAIGAHALIGVTTEPGRAVLRFAASNDVRQRLEQIVVAESACCAFMRFAVSEGVDAIVLTIEAPPGAELVTDDLVAAFNAGGAAA